ncbi:MAG: cupredoxin domain-containing protein [Thermoleophilia bacterium]
MTEERGKKDGKEQRAVARLGARPDAWMAVAIGFLLVAVVVLVGCSSSSSDPGATTTVQSSGDGSLVVKMMDASFEPETLTVKAGDTVRWVNEDSASHNAVAEDDSWGTDLFGEGGSGSVTFDAPGVYPFVCTAHAGMKGTIVVE